FGVEHALDRQAQLERLPSSLYGGCKEALGPSGHGLPGEWPGFLPGNGRGEGRSQMNVEHMQPLPTGEGEKQMLQRPIPGEGNRSIVGRKGGVAAELER